MSIRANGKGCKYMELGCWANSRVRQWLEEDDQEVRLHYLPLHHQAERYLRHWRILKSAVEDCFIKLGLIWNLSLSSRVKQYRGENIYRGRQNRREEAMLKVLVQSHTVSLMGLDHTSYLSREPRVYPCKSFLAGVNFYRFNAKNWHFRQILREKVAFFFTDLTRKIGVFRCKFYSPKVLPV